MKKILNIFSLSGIAIALLILTYLYWPKATVRASFDDFPTGQSRAVDFQVDGDALDGMTPREKVDQMRDWLLFTAMSGSGLSAEAVNQALYDLPPIRHGYLQPVSHFDYGDTRSCYIGDGQVLALLPVCTPEERLDRLAHVVDEHLKNTGKRPGSIEVFEYKIRLDEMADEATADLTRRETLDAGEMFTQSNGYYESKVKSVADLEQFLHHVDDITYAKNDDGNLLLGGRKIKGHAYRGVALSDVAAIWKSENRIHNASGGANRQVEGSGFSLDPTFDFEGLKKFFDSQLKPRLLSVLPQVVTEETPVYPSSIRKYLTPSVPRSVSPRERLDEVGEALDRKEADPFFSLLGEISEQNPQLAQLIDIYARGLFGFQAARYDGDLQGTEVGMTLFYTDLLAKLWALHYLNSTPTSAINDFLPLVAVHVSPIYQKEIEALPNTRVWFGPQDKGFQIVGSNQALLFAHNATRVYAASSDPFKPGVEATANAKSTAFLGWWDDHYEEIARYEPQYERLNQIMKWSLLISWLNKNNNGKALDYLQGVAVDHSNWFPNWVQRQPGLKFQQWSKTACSSRPNSETPQPVCFYERDYKGTKTEALPLLSSQPYQSFGKSRVLSGGVSLGSKQVFEGRAALSAETKIGELMLRSNVDYGASKVIGDAVRTLEGTAYRFSTLASDMSLVTAVAKDGTKLRGRFAELKGNVVFETRVARQGSSLNVEARAGKTSIGDLNIAPTENGFSVGWQSRELDAGQSLTRSLSRRPNLPAEAESIITHHPDVETAIRLAGDERYLVKFHGSDRWAKIATDEAAFSGITTEMPAQVADIGSSRSYAVAWLRDGEIKTELAGDHFLVVKTGETSEAAASLKLVDRRPPAASKPFESQIEGVKVKGQVDPATGEVYFRFDELPEIARTHPDRLSRLRGVTADSVDDPFIRAIRQGHYDEAMQNLLQSSQKSKGILQESFKSGVENVNHLIDGGHYDQALKRLNTMIDVHGVQPELALLKGIAKLGKRSPKLGETIPRVMREIGTEDVTAFYKEVNARLAQQASKDMTCTLVADGRKLNLHGQLSKVPEGVQVSPDALNQGDAIIYVDQSLLAQSTPGLNNLDWNVSVSQSVHEAVALDLARLEKVANADLANFRPSMLYVADPAIIAKSESATKALAFRGYYVPATPQPSNTDDDDEKKKRQKSIFILKAKAAKR